MSRAQVVDSATPTASPPGGGVAGTPGIHWQLPVGSASSSPVVADGTVYAGNNLGVLYAIHAESGAEVWRHVVANGQSVSSPAVVDGTVYFGVSHTYEEGEENQGMFYALDAVTGEEHWSFPAGSGRASPVVDDGGVFFGSSIGVHALDATTGATQWHGTFSRSCPVPPTIVGRMIYVVCTDGFIYALGDAGPDTLPMATAPGPTPPAIEESSNVVVSGSGVQLRAAPSAVAVVVADLAPGTNLIVIGAAEEHDGTTWWPVEDPSTGNAGYTNAESLALSEGDEAPQFGVVEMGIVCSGFARWVFNMPYENADTVEQLVQGAKYEIIGDAVNLVADGPWWWVRVSSETTGYIASECLTVQQSD